jgi:cell division protein FtsZ
MLDSFIREATQRVDQEDEEQQTFAEHQESAENQEVIAEHQEPVAEHHEQENHEPEFHEPVTHHESAPEQEVVTQSLHEEHHMPEPEPQRTEQAQTQRYSIKDELDAELEALLQRQMARIKVVGVGGAGNNTINRIMEIGVKGSEIIAVNTDAQDLLYANASKKILIGKEITSGLGAGSQPRIGEEAAKENEADLKKSLQESDLIFVTCGLGGGTGTGAAPVIAEVGKKLGSLVVGVVTLPFAMEGQRRYENAVVGLEKMENIVDTLIVIPNDKLLELAPDLPLQTAFKVVDEILANAVKGIAELITKAGLVNLDFADIRTVMGKGGVALIGVGESDSENRARS